MGSLQRRVRSSATARAARMRAGVSHAAIIAIVPCLLLSATGTAANTSLEASRDALNDRVIAQLQGENPEAAGLWREAIAAEAAGDVTKAAARYRHISELLPSFSPAVRRLCYAELQQGHAKEAIALCREALRQEASAENFGGLASVLAHSAGADAATLAEAAALATRAATLAPDDPHAQMTVCSIAMVRGRPQDTRDCADRLTAIAPDEPDTWVYAAFARASDGRFDDAKAHLDHAVMVGMPATQFDSLLANVNREVCSVDARRGDVEQAIARCREAVQLDASMQNLGMLAIALTWSTPAYAPTSSALDEAAGFAERAAELAPSAPFPQLAICQVAMRRNRLADLGRCSMVLRQIAPSDPNGWYFTAIARASAGQLGEAAEAARQARDLGYPAEDSEKLLSAIEHAKPLYQRWGPTCLVVLVVWAIAGMMLFLSGELLSRSTVRASEHLPTEPTGRPARGEALVRRAYKGILWSCCAYYYASIPVLIVAVVALGATAIYALFAAGYVPIKLLVLIIGAVLITTWAILKSVVVRASDVEPGTLVALDEHPRLRAVLGEVAERIGTRVVDNVYLTPGTDLAVTERGGGILKQLSGASTERCLILGVGVLDGMRLLEFKSILGHEYGHFQNRDTAGGAFALAVRRSLFTMAGNLAKGGVAAWYNPAWSFLNGFHRLFVRISHGASRLQETLCDRWAAFAYGSEAFERGLRHVVERSIAFDAHANCTLQEVVQQRRPLDNLYAYAPSTAIDVDDVARQFEERLHAKPSAYDSHPPPWERIETVRRLNTAAHRDPVDDAAAWSLFNDRREIERLMTDVVCARLEKSHGVVIPREETLPTPESAGNTAGPDETEEAASVVEAPRAVPSFVVPRSTSQVPMLIVGSIAAVFLVFVGGGLIITALDAAQMGSGLGCAALGAFLGLTYWRDIVAMRRVSVGADPVPDPPLIDDVETPPTEGGVREDPATTASP